MLAQGQFVHPEGVGGRDDHYYLKDIYRLPFINLNCVLGQVDWSIGSLPNRSNSRLLCFSGSSVAFLNADSDNALIRDSTYYRRDLSLSTDAVPHI